MNDNAADIIAALTGEQWLAKDTSRTNPPPNPVARLAYRLYETRGRQEGHDVDDWLLAEARLANKPAAVIRNIAVSIDGNVACE